MPMLCEAKPCVFDFMCIQEETIAAAMSLGVAFQLTSQRPDW